MDYCQSNTLGIWGYWPTGRFCDAIAPFTGLRSLKISWDRSEGRNLGNDVLSQLPKLCPNLELLSMVNAFLQVRHAKPLACTPRDRTYAMRSPWHARTFQFTGMRK